MSGRGSGCGEGWRSDGVDKDVLMIETKYFLLFGRCHSKQ